MKSGFSVRVKIKQFCQTKIKKLSLVNCKYDTQQFKREKITKNQEVNLSLLKVVQAKKSIWRMPWHWEPKKDVTSCDKLR